DKYWVFKEVTAEPGYPHGLVQLGKGLPQEGIDMALRWEPVGKTYFFKGNKYWRYNEEKQTSDPGYPKPITIWKGIPEAPQGAFVSKEGSEYVTEAECSVWSGVTAMTTGLQQEPTNPDIESHQDSLWNCIQ
ncbi:hypothetical protein scyTo_0023601, partial [Scyliorhinus torazame]|nr:hypothetical protein [Scyliorhinus torazame]